jgi:tripartite-type tricarboxylate transporter receptor subunit TctC
MKQVIKTTAHKAMTTALGLAGLVLLAGATSFAQAQGAAGDYPNRPIRMIVPFPPGGAADTTARMISEPMAKQLGQPIVVENKPGGGATIGAAFVATAPSDGYTILYTTPGPQITNPFLMSKLNYNPDDLLPVSSVASFANVLVVPVNSPAKNVKELIEFAKKNPGKVNFGSSGIGASSHLAGQLFKTMAGVDIEHVPYKGSGPLVTDLMGGNVQMAIDSLSVYLPQIRAGKLRALGVASLERSPIASDIPTIAEQLPGFEASALNYITVPKGTSPAIINKLNQAVLAVVNDPAMNKRMIDAGMDPKTSSPADLAKQIATEQAKWKKVISESGAKAD